jgi:hypothetical protein
MTKLKHLAKTIGYYNFFIYGLHHTIHSYPMWLTNQTMNPNHPKTPLIMRGLRTTHNREPDYHDSLHSIEVYTLYPQVVILSPFSD